MARVLLRFDDLDDLIVDLYPHEVRRLFLASTDGSGYEVVPTDYDPDLEDYWGAFEVMSFAPSDGEFSHTARLRRI